MFTLMSTTAAQALIHSPASSPDPQNFPQFGKLPLELRTMCWNLALPGPRVITITRCISELVKNDWADTDSSDQKLAKSNSKSPALLFVNAESRQIASAFYKLSFGACLIKPAYVDFARDTLFFPSSSRDLESFLVGEDVATADVKQIQKVILGVPQLSAHDYSVRHLRRMETLEFLILTHDHSIPFSYFLLGNDHAATFKNRLSAPKSREGARDTADDKKKELSVVTLKLYEVRQMAVRGVLAFN